MAALPSSSRRELAIKRPQASHTRLNPQNCPACVHSFSPALFGIEFWTSSCSREPARDSRDCRASQASSLVSPVLLRKAGYCCYLWAPAPQELLSPPSPARPLEAVSLKSMRRQTASAWCSLKMGYRGRTSQIRDSDLSSAIQGERAIREKADSPQLDYPAVIPSCPTPLPKTVEFSSE